MVHIIRGERPKKPPTFSITRGYTEELWDMTASCWDVNSAKRPTIDRVLNTLIVAAEQWKPKHGVLSTQNDWNPGVSEGKSDSATVTEPENGPVNNTSGSLTTFCHSKPPTMATDVLVNNLHTPHRSTNFPQVTSDTKLNTSGVQPQNAPETRSTLDQTVDLILAKAKSPLGESDARGVVEALEKVSREPLQTTDRRI